MDAILEIAAGKSLVVIEDSAHAPGASWRGKPVGGFGHFGSFSFQQSKNMTAGEGGILITNHDGLAEKARAVCNQGRRTGGGWFEHVTLGANYRLTGWQAAVLLAQLSRLPAQLEVRAANAAFLTEQLRQLDTVQPPAIDPRVTRHSYYLYMIRLNRDRLHGLSKERFVQALAAEGVPCADGYPYPLYCNPVFRSHEHRAGDCPEAVRMCAETFWVSHEILLAPRSDLDDFVAALAKVSAGAAELARTQDR
jgi:dTDP-4-amino-4,6-dideoxygalactose transaminase